MTEVKLFQFLLLIQNIYLLRYYVVTSMHEIEPIPNLFKIELMDWYYLFTGQNPSVANDVIKQPSDKSKFV